MRWAVLLLCCAACGRVGYRSFDGSPNGGEFDASIPRADSARLDGESADADAPDSEVPDSEVPDSEVPDADPPDSEVPDAEVPDSEVPDADIPDADVPDSEIPDADVPDSEIPDAEVPDAAAGPSIVSSPPLTGDLGPYRYVPSAAGGEGALTWMLISGPAGMVIDPDSGIVFWTPSIPGSYTVHIRVADQVGQAADQMWILRIDAT